MVLAPFQQQLEGEQSLDDALGVIKPVHSEHQPPASEQAPVFGNALLGLLVSGQPAELGNVNRDRRDHRRPGPAIGRHDCCVARRQVTGAHQVRAGLQEVLPVVLGMERHYIGSEQAGDDVTPPRQARVDVGRGPGTCMKKPMRWSVKRSRIIRGTNMSW